MTLWTRRGLLLAGAAPLLVPARIEESHHRVAPQRVAAHPVEPGRSVGEEEIARALAAPATSLRGFDGAGLLERFDTGATTTLAGGRTLREYEIVAEDRELEVAPGIAFPAWTYNGTVPGPTLRCTEGDRVRVHFTNRSISEHTIHFHGIHPADMDGVLEVVPPGGSYVYEFDAEPFGLQLYHCHVPPVDLHMNRGLYGAFIIDPPAPRPPARELVLVASGWDLDFDGHNEIYVLNGGANLYRDRPIGLTVGERVRIYFVNALEFDPINSLHVHANFFTALRRVPGGEEEEYTDLVTLCQADRRILELSFDHPGLFMFHAHQNRFAERGAMGHFLVAPADGPPQTAHLPEEPS